jgi:trans-aconitate 2-methyltransferase
MVKDFYMKPFEFDAHKYTAGSAHQKEWGQRIISELSIRGDESILDLGCGDGLLTKELAGLVQNGRVVGIDASENMIKKAGELKGANLSFALMDIDDLEFQNEFDIIFSNATLHWIMDHEKLLSNCYRALRHGGIIRFNFAGNGNCSNFNAVVREAMALPGYAAFFRGFEWPWNMPDLEEYGSLVKRSRFAQVKIWEENADRHFACPEDMVKWIDQPSLVPFLRVIPEKEKRAFRDLVVEQMLKYTRQPDNRCFETFRRINVLAEK